MIASVRMSEWELQDMGLVVEVGDELSLWLTFEKARADPSAEEIQTLRGLAHALPSGPGATRGRHPVRIDLEGGGALYWEAPAPAGGPLEVTGTISWNTIDAPDGFPETRGVVRRVRMVWHERIMGRDRQWAHTGGPRYEDVRASSFPPLDAEVAAGRLRSGDWFQTGLSGSTRARQTPIGTAETRWTGVLLDLDLTGSLD